MKKLTLRDRLGDIFGTLGGQPDFGPYVSNNNPVKKRSLQRSGKAKRGLPVM